jgi:hypothetical protein
MKKALLIIATFISIVVNGQNKYFVSSIGNNTNTGLTSGSPFATIQFAINASQSGDSIIVAPGIYQENINYSGKNIKVCSQFVYSNDTTQISSTIIDGGANGFPVVKFVSGEGPTAQLNGFTIRNGLVALSLTGAGIHVHGFGASPTLKNLIIRNNTLLNQGEGAGMTVFNTEALTILQNVKFLNNSSTQGVGGLKVHAGNISMINVEFRNNSGNVSAFARSIGAGSTDNYFYPLRNILIANNTGGLCVSGSGLVFMNSTFVANSGGIVLAGNSALFNSIIGSAHTITNQGILAIENSLIKDGQSSVINPIAAMLTYQENLNGSIFFNSNNFKLQSYSPAIGFGQDQFQYFSQTYKTSLFDIENNPRDTVGVTAVDLGCYENVLNQPNHNNKIYVSTNGTNIETVGLISSPFSSIQSAVDYSVDNDSIILLAGTYTENVLCGKTVHFRGQSGATNTIWQHNDMQSYLLTVFHPTWDNNNLKTPSVTGIKFFKNPNIVYNGNTHGLRAQQAARLTVNKCWFEDIRIATSTYYGVFNINNSVFYNIEFLAFNDAGYSEVDRLPKFNFCTIVNSLVLTAGSPAIYPTFTNCLITKSNPLTSSYFQGTQPMLTKVYIDQSVSTLTGSIYTVIPNIQHLGFVNAAIKDFHLKNSSPAIGYGAVVSGLNQDFDNVSRPQFSFPDIGAYEHTNNSPSNGAPFMINSTNLTFLEDQPIIINLTGIDDGDFFQTQTINLTATSNNTSIAPIPIVAYTPSQSIGNINFVPQLNSNGIAPIVLKIKDNGGVSNGGIDSTIYTLNVIVLSVNDAPIVNNDNSTTNEDTPVNISILSNDTDVDNSIVPTTIDLNLSSSGIQSSISNTQGVWNVNTLGVLTFTPALNFNGNASITYKVQDDSLAYSNIATVSVTVNPINDAPVATNNSGSTNEDTPITINILTNDYDVDNLLDSSSVDLNLILAGIQNSFSSASASWSVSSTGNLIINPTLNFNGLVSIDYKVKDALGLLSNTATVSINVIAVNDAPVAVNDTLNTNEDLAVSMNLLINDYDVDNALSSTTVDLNVVNPGVQTANVTTAGSWSVNTAGLITYTPVANFFGQATLNYTVKDASGLVSNNAQIIVIVNPVNDAPVAVNNTGLTQEDTPLTLNILSNDTDIDNSIDSASVDFDFVTVGIQSNFTNAAGSWSVNTHGVLTFTPILNYFGNATISYTVADILGLNSNTANITISVTSMNDAPLAVNDTLNTTEDNQVSMNILTNDSDVDNAISSNTVDLNPGTPGIQNNFAGINGTFSVNSTGVISFTPTANFFGVTGATYTVKDVSGAVSNTATINVNVSPINDAPFAANNIATTAEDTPISLNILANDLDVENQLDSTTVDLNLNLTGIQSVLNTASGNWAVNSVGLLTYTPILNFNGITSMQYQVKDQQGLNSNIALVSITVNSINDAPDTLQLSNSSINENFIGTVGILNTIDVDSNQVFTYSLIPGLGSTNNSNFTIVNNQLQNTIAFNYEGLNQQSIRIKTTDQGGLSKEQICLINVLNVNDIQVSDTILDTYCNGVAANGSINISVSQTNGSVGYTWSGPNLFTANTPDISGLESGNYTLTIIDILDTAVFNFTLGQIPTYEDLSICYVTGDTMPGNHNRIYFNNPGMYNVQYYQILRESTSQGVFDFIGQVTPLDTSFLDLVSNNQAQTFSYKVRAIDSCGNFSSESNSHTTMLLQANLSASNSVNLTWTPYSGTGYTSYYLYRSVNGGIFDLLVTLPASQFSFNDVTANVTTNQYLYFVSIVVPSCDFTKSNNSVRSNIKYLTDGGLGFNELKENQLVVSPNPSNGIFNISKTDDFINQNKIYEILNPYGQILMELDFNETINFKSIDLSPYSDGVYFIKEKYGTWIYRLVLSK